MATDCAHDKATDCAHEFDKERLLRRVDVAEQTFNVIREHLLEKIAEVEGRHTKPEPALRDEIDKCHALVADVRALLREARARLAGVPSGLRGGV